MTTAYQSDAYQNNAYQIDAEAAVEGFAFQQCVFQDDAFQVDACGVEAEQYSGGWEHVRGEKRRTKEEIRKARAEYGLAFEVIETVAKRQSEQLLTDEQKQYDELAGELKIAGLEMESRYLEALNNQRQALVNAEIGRLLRVRIEEEEIFMMLASMVANRMI